MSCLEWRSKWSENIEPSMTLMFACVFLQGNSDPTLSVHFFHILYTLLEHDPPWKSPSMLRYYLDVLQCPVCMRGTWPLVEMLVR